MTRYGTTMSEALAEVREGFSPKQIKMAIGIASDKRYAGVNMSGAVSAIEKIKRGLADHPQVAAVLKAKNEDTEPQESVQEVSEMPQESVPVYEGKMKELHGYISKGKTAEWIANKMGFSVKDIKSLMDEEDDLEEAAQILAHGGKGQYKAVTNGGVISIKYKGKEIASGDFDRGADAFFLSWKDMQKGKKNSRPEGSSFDTAQDMVDFFAKKKITEEFLEEAFSSWTVTAVKSVNKVKKGDSKTVKAQNVSQALKKSAKAWGDEMLNNVSSTFFKVTKDTSESIEEASKEGTIRIIDLGNRNQDKIRKDLGVDKLPNKGFQVQVMTKGKFVNVSTPYKTMKDAEKVRKSGQHSLGLDEKYDLYHKTFSGAMQHSYEYSKKKFGIEIDPNEIDDKVATGPAKPKTGKTNSYRLKGKDGKKGIQVQVYNTGKSFELNMYKEEVELEDTVQITKLKESVKVLGKINPTGPAYQEAVSFIESLEEGTWLPDAELNEMKMNDPKLLKVFDNLKKGSTVKIKSDSTIAKGEDYIEYIVKSKNVVNKGKVEKITLATKEKPNSVKKFLYKRDDKVTMAMGNMAVSVVDIKEEGLKEGPEVYTVKKGKFARKVDGKTADKMKKDGWKLISAGDEKTSSSAKTRIAQLQLQIAKSQETINKLKET